MPSKPLLLVDVDGVISLFGFAPQRPPAGQWQMVDGIAHLLSADAGRHLRALGEHFELVWCTGWEEKANEYLPLALSLPGPLPHLSFETSPGTSSPHWKLAAIDAYAGPHRSLAWIDDALGDQCRDWAANRPGPTLLVETDPAVGLTAAHVRQLLAWARSAGLEGPMASRPSAEAG